MLRPIDEAKLKMLALLFSQGQVLVAEGIIKEKPVFALCVPDHDGNGPTPLAYICDNLDVLENALGSAKQEPRVGFHT